MAESKKIKLNKLTSDEKRIIIDKGTELPNSGVYNNHYVKGMYSCKQCNALLFRSSAKFDGHCGWPSFDDSINNAINQIRDEDRERTEIICNNCNGHLGHIFFGEGFTSKNARYCVNSISMNFIPEDKLVIKNAIFAGGCFWGVDYFFSKKRGVIETQVGYIGGQTENPTYEEVCYNNTGHVEAINVFYDPAVLDYEDLVKYFFEIHNPEQENGQGPDIGEQYKSYIFYFDEREKKIANIIIDELKNKKLRIATKLREAETFWIAEEYHQNYYAKNKSLPYCHFYIKRF